MIMEDCYDINLETEDDPSIKIFEKLNFENEEIQKNEGLLSINDSNMKMYIMS